MTLKLLNVKRFTCLLVCLFLAFCAPFGYNIICSVILFLMAYATGCVAMNISEEYGKMEAEQIRINQGK